MPVLIELNNTKEDSVKKLSILITILIIYLLNIVFAQGLAKKAGGTVDDKGNGIAIDGSDNSLVTGSFKGTATFGAGCVLYIKYS